MPPAEQRRETTHAASPPRALFSAKLFLDRRLLDGVEIGKVLRQIGVAFHLHAPLVGTAAARGALAVFGVELVDDLHPLDHAAERREALAVEAAVLTEVDEHLGRACVGTCHGE